MLLLGGAYKQLEVNSVGHGGRLPSPREVSADININNRAADDRATPGAVSAVPAATPFTLNNNIECRWEIKPLH